MLLWNTYVSPAFFYDMRYQSFLWVTWFFCKNVTDFLRFCWKWKKLRGPYYPFISDSSSEEDNLQSASSKLIDASLQPGARAAYEKRQKEKSTSLTKAKGNNSGRQGDNEQVKRKETTRKEKGRFEKFYQHTLSNFSKFHVEITDQWFLWSNLLRSFQRLKTRSE